MIYKGSDRFIRISDLKVLTTFILDTFAGEHAIKLIELPDRNVN